MALTRDDFFWTAFISHAEKSVKAGALLLDLVSTPSRIDELYPAIAAIESEGDSITHEVMAALHQTWITPLDREEIHQLVKRLDDFLDAIEEVSERYRICGVSEAKPQAVRMALAIKDIADRVGQVMKMLRNPKEAQAVLKLLVEINDREMDADKALYEALEDLFKTETRPIEVIKWHDLFQRLESATDAGEEIAHVIEGIVLEHA